MNLNDIIKKNEAYDQKFLFKKNFIPKQKPVMINNAGPGQLQGLGGGLGGVNGGLAQY